MVAVEVKIKTIADTKELAILSNQVLKTLKNLLCQV